jgi:ABC-type sugar transport system permease subunit
MNASASATMAGGVAAATYVTRRPLLQRLVPFLYVLPAVAFVGFFLLYPMVVTLWQSFTSFDGITDPVFNGLDNYRELFADPNFLLSLRNTLIWTVASVIFPVTLGLVFALGINGIRGAGFFKTSVYLPATISAAAVGILFTFIFDPANGVINASLDLIGLGALRQRWLFEAPLNTFSMIAAYTWQQTGLNMMLFLVGLQGLAHEPLEAAKLDGCTSWQLTRRIVLPMLMPYIVIATLLAVINGFKVFDLIWVMTQGGPSRTSETLAVTMYREAFILFRLGYSASIAVIISIAAIAFSYFYMRSVVKQETQI